MRILVGLLAVLWLTVSSVGVSAAVPPGSSYTWVQPGTAIVSTPFAQPPAWIFAFATRSASLPLSSYAWAQPGAAIVSTPFAQPPAWIPIG